MATSELNPELERRLEERNRDLGFGSVVSRESQKRLLNRDGTFNVAREGLGAEFLTLLTAIDETFSQAVHSRLS